ncbi:SDR family oxidoreductase [Zavarzinia aquatilis]|uniref:NAD-dependent dehydratase n=1 Tax=Zavarzinia aquatilis TaxID=2211142 RepID=A0A317EGJ2_9PROT|nr:SDR family oxidoreductase [Zavarzinia aquatilis]PWR25434.1 NAD-dependent dehydratase [Zavarzinia aquatilis]
MAAITKDGRRTAIVSGGLGVIGRNLVDHLSESGEWNIIALSRRGADFESKATYVPIDLLDPVSSREVLAQFTDVDCIFHAAYQERQAPAEQVSANLDLLRNLVTGVAAASPGLSRVVHYEGAKYYGVHLGAFPTPAKESDARHMPPNFYYDQEDWLKEASAGASWDYVVLRPDVVCGFAVGSPMSLVTVLAVYALISKELGLPLKFPGTADCYTRLAQVTDAGQLAAASAWAIGNAAGGEAYNVTNGDLFRWNQLWPALARMFDMEVGGVQTIRLTEFMADKAPIWQRIVEKHGLRNIAYDKIAAWGFGDFVFRCDFDVISSMTKIRLAGFNQMVDSEAMFQRLFTGLRQRRVIP